MHISDHDLERHYLGMVTGTKLEAVEEHIVGCPSCADGVAEIQDYVDAMRTVKSWETSTWKLN